MTFIEVHCHETGMIAIIPRRDPNSHAILLCLKAELVGVPHAGGGHWCSPLPHTPGHPPLPQPCGGSCAVSVWCDRAAHPQVGTRHGGRGEDGRAGMPPEGSRVSVLLVLTCCMRLGSPMSSLASGPSSLMLIASPGKTP